MFSTTNRGPARGSHDRGGYDLLGLSAGMFDHTSWHPYLPQGTTPGLVPAAMWSPRPFRPSSVIASWFVAGVSAVDREVATPRCPVRPLADREISHYPQIGGSRCISYMIE